MTPYDFRNRTVLITGASLGIGASFARALSARGAHLVLVARNEARLSALAKELGRAHVIPADLTTPDAPQRLFDDVRARGLTIDVLINNAGFGVHGPFADVPLPTHLEQIDLNVRALVALTHLFMPMLEAQRGGVIQVASLAGHQPSPFFSTYGATKAFVLAFTAALWAEYEPRGVRVLALSPGATETAFFQRAGNVPGAETRASPNHVAQLGLTAFAAGRPAAIHGAGNRALVTLSRLFSREFSARTMARMMRRSPPPALPGT
ncbi:SDR family NAD(P)-dependent oxidoreductase [Chondromyces apiculatus]|uniref:Short-chain dehydrogenase/reductase SDR n=1 Tax=Chondromyces apiculatus DSM 436 TaxID=1192034 RepID=A0A017T1U1_9BACT|nr:SDR family oxidoreductase [Chondromyces apiculatus]EYF03229.1 short-chain dehydrogenase/reductase SDR [Chondromyces apiculatus DSM 436]